MRLLGGAFSDYARGRFFSQCPVGHCSFPPRLRRLIHENLASLRFSVSYLDIFYNNLSRKENHYFDNFSKKAKPRFCFFHSIWQSLALRKGCSCGILIICVPLIIAQAKPRFCVSATVFANTFAFAGKVNAARILWRALKKRAAKENSDGQRLCRVPWGCPQNLDFLFRQLETKSEKGITYPFPRRPAERRP